MGKYRRTRLFVLTLGYSRKAVRLLRKVGSASPRGDGSLLAPLLNDPTITRERDEIESPTPNPPCARSTA
jgi:hypothetical protein